MPLETYVDPVIGYRSWNVNVNSNELYSRIIRGLVWPADKPFKAKCEDSQFRIMDESINPVHEPPDWGCTCGLYAFNSLKDCIDKYSAGTYTVVGACVFWGRMVLYTEGFRAQYGRVVAISQKKLAPQRVLNWTDILERVVEKYNVPLVPLDILEDYARTWGTEIIPE